jgi:F-type H+-transporting ATPase subunit delta
MSVYRISYRYANSLIQLAEEKKIFNKISADANLVFNTLQSSKELRAILKSPIIKLNDKKSLLQKIFDKKISSQLQNFIDFVVEKNREEILTEIFQEFLNLVDKKNNLARARITTAIELNEQQKQNMEKKLQSNTGRKISADYKINENIIGGFIVNINDVVYDASVKHQLNLLRKKFSEETVINN